VYPTNRTAGNYVLDVAQPVMFDDPPPRIQGTIPDDGQVVGGVPAVYRVRLSEPVLATSVDAGDLTVDGRPAQAARIVDGRTVEFVLDLERPADGIYTVGVAAGSFLDLQGQPLATPLQATFAVDTVGPTIVETRWNGLPFPETGILPAGPLVVEAILSEEVFVLASARRGPFTPGRDDIVLAERRTGATYAPSSVDFDAGTQTVRVEFPEPLPEGDYTLTFSSGAGAITDLVFNGLDGEPVGPNQDGTPTGDGEPGGDYVVEFLLDNADLRAEPFQRLDPRGVMVFESRGTTGWLHDATDRDAVVFDGQQGQTVTAVVTFDAPVPASVRLADGSEAVQALAGEPVVLPPRRLIEDGEYQLEVSAEGAAGYRVDLYLNAAIELQVADTTIAEPLPLDGARLDVAGGRWAVLGVASGNSSDVDQYTVDLSGRSGSSLDVVLAGQRSDFSGQTLELIDFTGNTVASAVADGQGTTLRIRDYRIPETGSAGRYSLRFTSDVAGGYILSVTLDQVIHDEADDQAAPQSLDELGTAIGYLAADESVVFEPDDYPVDSVLDRAMTNVRLSEFASGNSVFASRATTFRAPTGQQVFGNAAVGPAGWLLGGNELRADFRQPVSVVSFAVGSTAVRGEVVVLLALDADGEVLEITSASSVLANTSEVLTIVRPQRDIHAVAVAGLIHRAPIDQMTFASLVPDLADAFVVSAEAGEQIAISAFAPFAAGQVLNSLHPGLAVFQPDGSQIAAISTGQDESRTGVRFTAPVDGLYRVEVRADAGGGEYVLRVNRGRLRASADALAVAEGGTAVSLVDGALSVLENDSGLADEPVSVSVVSGPRHAAEFLLRADGTFLYQHDGSENFHDEFVYRVSDTAGQSDSATVSITIDPVSDTTPDAVPDRISVGRGETATELLDGATSLLANDTGLNDTPITIRVDTAPSHAAEFVVHGDGTFRYRHDGGESLQDSFTYRIRDNDGQADVAVVEIEITPANLGQPEAVEDAIVVPEGAAASELVGGQVSVLSNDRGLLDDPVAVSLEMPPVHATSFALHTDGTFAYQHDGTENFTDTFVYRVTDRDGEFDTAVVSVTIKPVSDTTPIAQGDAITLRQGAATSELDSGASSVLANDTGLADEPVLVELLSPPAHAAQFSLNPDGTFHYVHDGSESLQDSFRYRITDNDGESATGTVQVSIVPAGTSLPLAVEDVVVVAEGQLAESLDDGQVSVLANDQGLEDTPLELTIEQPPLYASEFVLRPDGTFRYWHDGSENFTDSLLYRVTDRDGDSSTGEVRILVTPVSDGFPVAIGDTISVPRGGTVTRLANGVASVLEDDVGLKDTPITVSLHEAPRHAAEFQLFPDGTFLYRHDGTETTEDLFLYRITDNDGQVDTATVTIMVTAPVGALPQARDDLIAVDEGAVADLVEGGEASVLANDSGLDDAPVSVALEMPPRYATQFVLNPDGTFRYEHDGSENFRDEFRYTVTDRDGQSDAATVTVRVEPVSDATPQASDDQLVVDEGGTWSLSVSSAPNLLANDTGLEDGPILVQLETPPRHAARYALDGDGRLEYTHDGSENFRDTLVYRVTDNDGQTDTATVQVVINPVSDATPQAVADTMIVAAGEAADRLTTGADSVLANDVGLDDTPIQVALTRPPAHALGFSLGSDGTFRYVHDGTGLPGDSFAYALRDNDGQTDEAEVFIEVRVPPLVSGFQPNAGRGVFDALSAVAFQFDRDVAVSSAALIVKDQRSGVPVALSGTTFQYEPLTRTARWELPPTLLGIGWYQVALRSEDVTDSAGTHLDGDGDGRRGGDYQVSEPLPVTWVGDADLDLDVDFADFVLLANNFSRSQEVAWREGDFDGDGSVGFSDFVALSNNFGRSLSSASPRPQAARVIDAVLASLVPAGSRQTSGR
jgi:hypothetical protein